MKTLPIHNQVLDLLAPYDFPIKFILFPKQFEKYDTINMQQYQTSEILSAVKELIRVDYISSDIDIIEYKVDALHKLSEDSCFNLTSKGGKVWERIYQPDWNYFIELFVTDLESTILLEIESTNKENIINSILPLKEVIKLNLIEEIHPWQPKTWKKLPNGYKFRQVVDIKFENDINKCIKIASKIGAICCPKSSHIF